MIPEIQTAVPKVSVVFPVFNEEGNIRPVHERVSEALSETELDYELIFVDDGSSDSSLEIIKDLSGRDHHVRYVSLSRNFGHQAALFAGMKHSRGAAVITMDADLQHPPSLIPKMVRFWRQGHDVVFTMKSNQRLGLFKGAQMRLFYWLLSRMSGLKLSFGQSDFRLLNRKALNALLEIGEYHKFHRGTVEWIGFRQVGIKYQVQKRHSGKPRIRYGYMVSTALDGILAFSSLPLRWISAMGAVIATLGIGYALVVITLALLGILGMANDLPPGWASVAVAVTFLGGVQLLAVGILGEYLSRVYDQSKGRPVFIARETSESNEERPIDESIESVAVSTHAGDH